MKPKTKTFKVQIILNPEGEWKNPNKDFGIGPGVLVEAESEYSDRNCRGFNSPMFAAQLVAEDDEWLRKYFAIRRTEIKKRPANKQRKRLQK